MQLEIQEQQTGHGGNAGAGVAWLLYSVAVGARWLGSHCLSAACNMFVLVNGSQDAPAASSSSASATAAATTSGAPAAATAPNNVTWHSVHDKTSCSAVIVFKS